MVDGVGHGGDHVAGFTPAVDGLNHGPDSTLCGREIPTDSGRRMREWSCAGAGSEQMSYCLLRMLWLFWLLDLEVGGWKFDFATDVHRMMFSLIAEGVQHATDLALRGLVLLTYLAAFLYRLLDPRLEQDPILRGVCGNHIDIIGPRVMLGLVDIAILEIYHQQLCEVGIVIVSSTPRKERLNH